MGCGASSSGGEEFLENGGVYRDLFRSGLGLRHRTKSFEERQKKVNVPLYMQLLEKQKRKQSKQFLRLKNAVKCVVVGNSAVGKTSLIHSMKLGFFPEKVPKVNGGVTSKHFQVGDRSFDLNVWDTADGQPDKWVRQRSSRYSKTNVFIVCASRNSLSSLQHIAVKWLPEVWDFAPGTPWLLCVSQNDYQELTLREAEDAFAPVLNISDAEFVRVAKQLQASAVVFTSALHNEGVNECFETAIQVACGKSTAFSVFGSRSEMSKSIRISFEMEEEQETCAPVEGARKNPPHEFYGTWEGVEKAMSRFLEKPCYGVIVNGEQVKIHHNSAGVKEHHNCMSNHLTEALYNRLRSRVTRNGVTLDKCIKPGVENPGHPMKKSVGLVAGDAECYETFKELFDAVIHECHEVAFTKHSSDLDVTKLKDSGLIDTNYVVSTGIWAARNVQGFPFPPSCSAAERREIEKLVVRAAANLTDDFAGNYWPLSGSDSCEFLPGGMTSEHEENLKQAIYLLSPKEFPTLFVSAGLHRDWPDGRGIFHTYNKDAAVCVNETDHLRIVSVEPGADVNATFARFVALIREIEKAIVAEGFSFARHSQFGFATTCPSNSGTGLRACMRVKLPNLSKRPDYAQLVQSFGLQVVQREAGVSDGISDVFETTCAVRLGKTEVQLVNALVDGVVALVAKEKELEKQALDTLIAAASSDSSCSAVTNQKALATLAIGAEQAVCSLPGAVG